jgi:hypothetical protein
MLDAAVRVAFSNRFNAEERRFFSGYVRLAKPGVNRLSTGARACAALAFTLIHLNKKLDIRLLGEIAKKAKRCELFFEILIV